MSDLKKRMDEQFEAFVFDAIQKKDIDLFRQEFLEFHPYDQAKFYVKQEKDVRILINSYLTPAEMAELFHNIDVEEQEDILHDMEPAYAADMLAEMYADDAVDVLNELQKDQVVSYLTIMDNEAAQEIKDLLHYEEKTAGSIMTTEFVSISANQTVRNAMKILKTEAPDAETIYYLYVTDDEERLVGVISLRDLIISDEDKLISEAMNDRVVSVSVSEDQENVAKMMKDYDFLALPVVDFQRHLLGIITVDDIIDVMEEEASDDYSKLAGVPEIDSSDYSSISAARKRLPWLIILLFLGMFTASLIGRFESALSQLSILAVFIPLIAGMAGNTGTQALAVAVRGIATGDIGQTGTFRILKKEIGTGIIVGLICGILVMITVNVWQHNFALGLLVGISIFLTVTVSTFAGAVVPLVMHRFKIDPAVASGPFITTINDIISILIYFGLATFLMNYLI
ncbi:magnesium transporter [Calidifontibacillus oryziterrae]|uniref:magnesium transporter n=1 Tax=Calidifontibacillus oryziterrae TaxID=1191699 RepID=UPI0003158A76|nr:magnesium transporter [Calidifontibacillus oryziterrae]